MAEHGHAERYRQHILDGDEPCPPCREAERIKKAAYRKRRYLNRGPMLVDPTGARRRIQALAAVGWPAVQLADRLGCGVSNVSKWMRPALIHVDTHRRVAALYDELAMHPGPSEVSRRVAAARGWPPPLAWDDDTIDDPQAQPAHVPPVGKRTQAPDEVAIYRATHGDRVPLTTAERREAVRILTERGHSKTQIAATLRVAERVVERDRTAA